MVVVGIFVMLFSTLAGILLNSQRSWEAARDKLIEGQQARRATDRLIGLLREANPDWDIGGTHYPVTISESNTRIDFYTPVFNSTGNVTSLRKITFKIDPNDSTQLLAKEGTATERIAASAIDTFNINCACTGCVSIDQNCPMATVNVVTMKNVGFNWTAQVTLRNSNMAVSATTEVEEPPAGEF
jgi:hypothetical protein